MDAEAAHRGADPGRHPLHQHTLAVAERPEPRHQVVVPHDKGIIDEVNAVPLKELSAFLAKDLTRVIMLRRPADDAYLAVAHQAVLDPAIFKKEKFKVVFTNIHGTGGVATVPLLAHAGELPEP